MNILISALSDLRTSNGFSLPKDHNYPAQILLWEPSALVKSFQPYYQLSVPPSSKSPAPTKEFMLSPKQRNKAILLLCLTKSYPSIKVHAKCHVLYQAVTISNPDTTLSSCLSPTIRAVLLIWLLVDRSISSSDQSLRTNTKTQVPSTQYKASPLVSVQLI